MDGIGLYVVIALIIVGGYILRKVIWDLFGGKAADKIDRAISRKMSGGKSEHQKEKLSDTYESRKEK